MTLTCQICGEQDVPQNHFYNKHKISIEKYFLQYFPKNNLLTNKPLPFKNYDSYLFNDFDNKNELKIYLNRIEDHLAKRYCLEKFKQRKTIKNLIYAPSQFELRSIMLPTINYIEKRFGDYNKLVSSAGFKPLFDYEKGVVVNNNKVNVLVDTREKKPLSFEEITIQKLDYGDYSVANSKIFIERKSLSDFIGTLSSGYERFLRELERAKENNCYLIIMIESEYGHLMVFDKLKWIMVKKAKPDFILHRVREILEKYPTNCQFVATGSREKSEELVNKIYNIEDIKNFDLQFLIDIGGI